MPDDNDDHCHQLIIFAALALGQRAHLSSRVRFWLIDQTDSQDNERRNQASTVAARIPGKIMAGNVSEWGFLPEAAWRNRSDVNANHILAAAVCAGIRLVQ